MRDLFGAAVVTRHTPATTPTLLSAASPRRGALLVYVEPGASTCYVLLGEGPSTTSYTVQVPAGYLVNVVDLDGGGVWTGPVTCVWAGAVGATQVTEVTR